MLSEQLRSGHRLPPSGLGLLMMSAAVTATSTGHDRANGTVLRGLATEADTLPDPAAEMECSIFQNNTALETAEGKAYSEGQTLFVSVFLPVVLGVGVLNNLAFVYVVVRVPRMRTVTNCYLLGLAVADVLFLVFAIGSRVWCFVHSPIYGDDTPLGLSGCLLTQFIINTSYFTTLCFITLVSWERYNGVCRPHRRRDTKARVFQLMLVSFVGSSLMSASLLLSLTKIIVECIAWPDRPPFDQWPRRRQLFFSMDDWVDMYSYGAQTVPFFTSLVVNVVFYHRIIRGLDRSMNRSRNQSSHHHHRCGGGSGSSNNADSSTRNQVARMLVINGIALFALLAPFEIMSLFQLLGMVRGYEFILPQEAREYLVAVARVMSYFNAIVNPVIYTALSSRYRASFKVAFMPAYCRSHQRQRIENSMHGSTVTVQCGVSSKTHESRM